MPAHIHTFKWSFVKDTVSLFVLTCFKHVVKTFCTLCMTFYDCGISGTILNKSDQTNSPVPIKVRKVKRKYLSLSVDEGFKLNCLVAGVNFTGIGFIYHGLKEAA